MTNKVTRFGAVVSLSALFMLFVAGGCGGGDTVSSTPEDTLVVALEDEPPELDPAFSSAFVDRQVMASVYDKLVDIDQEGEIVPMLAEDYEVSEDGLTYTFELQDGVVFHDGTEFNAEAVKTNLERYQTDESTRSTEVQAIESVEVVDPLTVEVTLSEPFAPFLSVLADRAGIMASPQAIEENDGRISQNPVGTGPYSFVERLRGQSITVERNEEYWGEEPQVQNIEYRGINDPNVQFQNLRSGELDVIDQIPFVEMQSLEEDGEYTVSNEPGLGYQGIFLNNQQEPFDNEQLRQAVYTLVNREAIVDAVLRGEGGVAGNSPFGPASLAYGETDEFERGTAEEARALLEEAGEPDGFTFTLKIDPSPDSQQLGQVVQNSLEPAGINVELERVEFGTLLEQGTSGDFQALFLGWSGRVDPDQNIYDFMVTDGDDNDSGYSNEEVDRLLNEARRISDEGERKELYDQAMEIIHEEAPYVYLYHQNNDFALQSNVEGFEAYPDGILRPIPLSKQAQE